MRPGVIMRPREGVLPGVSVVSAVSKRKEEFCLVSWLPPSRLLSTPTVAGECPGIQAGSEGSERGGVGSGPATEVETTDAEACD